MRGVWATTVLAVGIAVGSAVAGVSTLRADSQPTLIAVGSEKPAELPGLHNVFHLSAKLYSGSVPEGEAGFASLRALGIRTVLSVDGMPPETELAAKFGMRYVHLPFGYDGCPTPNADRIVRAVRDLPGPIYLHCHHGKHRAPAAAALARIGVDGLSPDQAVREMERAGTGKNYVGLYAGVRAYHPTPEGINAAPADFPSRARTPKLVDTMVAMEGRLSRLEQAQKAGWPRDQDATKAPEHDALQLRELLTELQRGAEFRRRPADFRAWAAESETSAKTLEQALKGRNAADAGQALGSIKARCGACHAKYRDVPQQ